MPPKSPAIKITMSQISREANVSVSAISSFLNNREYGIRVGADTQARIIEACRRLNYQPKSEYAMRRLYPEQGNICFLLNSDVPQGTQHEYFGKMLSGIITTLNHQNQSVVYALFSPRTDYTQEPEKLPKPMTDGSCTRFIAASAPNASLVRYAINAGLPFIYLGHVIDIPGAHCIIPDYIDATRQSVHYLNSLGHERIAYITGPLGEGLYNMAQMERGFAMGMQECNLPMRTEYICHCESHQGEFSRESLTTVADHLMNLPKPPTAILCFHDPAATVISGYLQTQGLNIPKDVSIMGCNDEPCATTHHPTLSTVHFPLCEMGQTAIKTIDRQITTGEVSAETSITTLPVKVIERNSCAAPRQ